MECSGKLPPDAVMLKHSYWLENLNKSCQHSYIQHQDYSLAGISIIYYRSRGLNWDVSICETSPICEICEYFRGRNNFHSNKSPRFWNLKTFIRSHACSKQEEDITRQPHVSITYRLYSWNIHLESSLLCGWLRWGFFN